MLNKSKNDWIKLSSIGLEISFTIFFLTWGGNYLDNYFSLKKAWFTILGASLGTISSIILLIQMSNDKK